MTIESEVAALTTATTALLAAVNTRKSTLDFAVNTVLNAAPGYQAIPDMMAIQASTQSTAANALASVQAKASAEAARDAAIIGSGVYATEALGRAAVADGVAFKVQGSGDVAAYEYRRTNSATSVLIATYPSSSSVRKIHDALSPKEIIGRKVPPIAGLAASASTFVFGNPATQSSSLTNINIWALGTGTITLNKWTISGSTATRIFTTTINVPTTGAVTLDSSNYGYIPVSANEYLSIKSNGVLGYTVGAPDGVGWYQVSDVPTAAIGGLQSGRIEVGFVLTSDSLTVTDTAFSEISIAAASAVDAASTALENVVVLSDSLNIDNAQTIGRPASAILTDGIAISNQTYVDATQVSALGGLSGISVYSKAAGTLTVSKFTKSGSTLTRTGFVTVPVAAGLNTLDASHFSDQLAVSPGDYLGIAGTGLVAYVNGSNTDGPGHWFTTSMGGVIAEANGGYLFQIRYFLSAKVVTGPAFSAIGQRLAVVESVTPARMLSLSNVDKIGIVSNSYNEFIGGLLGKAPACILSALSEYNFSNFSQGGADVAAIATNLATGVSKFGATFAAHKNSYAVLIENQNSKQTNSMTDAVYYAGTQKVLDVMRGLGVQPILASEFGGVGSGAATVDGEQRNVRGLRALADANGIPFIDGTAKSRTMSPAAYSAFWKSGHPATRTCYLIIDGLRKGLKQLPRPGKSMKIFRVRGTVTVGSAADLVFRSVQERHRLFRELYIGHTALSETEKLKYDTASGLYDGTQTRNDEYIALAAGSATALGAYALLDVVLPVHGATGVQLTISDTSVAAYARKLTSTGSSWVALTLTSGKFVVPDGAGLVDGDRLSILLYKVAGVSLNASPVVEWTGGLAKMAPMPAPVYPPRGVEMLTQPLPVAAGIVAAQWVNTGALPVVAPADGILPTGTTGCVEVTSTAGLAQAFAYSSSDDPVEVVIRVWARRWVPIFNAASDFAIAPVTYETCDTGTLQVTLHGSTGIASASAVLKDQVGLHWTEVELRETLPAGTTATTVDVRSSDLTLQIAKVSVRTAF